MAKKSLEPLTEPMFYILLCFHRSDMCGTEISSYVNDLTDGRVKLGPGTLYSLLSLFQAEDFNQEVTTRWQENFLQHYRAWRAAISG